MLLFCNPLFFGGGPFRRRHFSAADSALDNSTPCRFGAGHFGAVYKFILFFELWRKNNEAGNFLNAVEREHVETRVLNPTASEASYKPKQRSYRTTNLKKKVQAPNSPGAEMSGAELSSAETYPTPGYSPLCVLIFYINKLFLKHRVIFYIVL